ncbi:nucleotide-diphospho-sugar transferase [Dunaliella salina]|uniref:Nucleotide-diphospho-sugar transferase n=1 Tax=Dunaliella salina TaxID=3046 RepID=A0ABQ7GVS9_DUNSA|nr:nucleotide-diphospho-sugar transferase [Dunaliella salina]|eukprot:KAF5838717.1 nucleotide-diphospho-sugar transferase [Dunaliella salina]
MLHARQALRLQLQGSCVGSKQACRTSLTWQSRKSIRHTRLGSSSGKSEASSGDLSGGHGGGGNNGRSIRNESGGDGPRAWGPVASLLGGLLQAFLGWMLFLTLGSTANDLIHIRDQKHDTAGWKVSIIIPALNEEGCICALVQKLYAMYAPEALEIIVVDGGSSDRTTSEARRGGASKVLTSSQRGRAAQMNVGAASASGDILVFMHADTTKPPADLPHVLRRALAEPRTCVVGMLTLIRGTPKKRKGDTASNNSRATMQHAEGSHATAADDQEKDGPLLKFMTFHQCIKTSFYPMLLQPVWYLQGFRLLFGDQVMCCRRNDFTAVQGFKTNLPIMEDADLCIRLHKAGPSEACKLGYRGHGRVHQLMGSTTETSGRRLEEWGNLWGSWVLFRIAISWYCGASGDQLKSLYTKLYTDAFR